jgi:DNA-binding winged helix-turn-helix (wHTH) protein
LGGKQATARHWLSAPDLESCIAASEARGTAPIAVAFAIATGRSPARAASVGHNRAREPQVFDLLVFLLRNRDRTVSKDEILMRCGTVASCPKPHSSSRINAARKALGDNGTDQNLIRTVHKRGFRFVADVREELNAATASRESAPRRCTTRDKPNLEGASGDRRHRRNEEQHAVRSGAPFANVSGDPGHEYFAYA